MASPPYVTQDKANRMLFMIHPAVWLPLPFILSGLDPAHLITLHLFIFYLFINFLNHASSANLCTT